jgi:two-component system, NtrC family, response regulator
MDIKVLIIDDEPQIRTLLSRIISLEGYNVLQADSINSAKKQISSNQPDIILCDVLLPDGNGIDIVPELKSMIPDGEIIMLTAHGNIADGVKSIKNGAYDYLTKGDDNNRIIPMLSNAAEKIKLKKRVDKLQSLIKKEYTFDSIIGDSRFLKNAEDLAKKVAPTDAAVLLTGETGTGKEVFATAIHQASNRKNKNFVAVNCGALSHELLESELFGYKAGAFTGATKDKIGLFEQADKGTIFLDEVGEMPIELQVKLLRALETGEFIPVGDTITKKVDVRIITATNKDLKEAIKNNEFREDLFYRLSVFSIELPPLRERENDIVTLAKYFLNAFASKMNKSINGMEDSFVDAIKKYSWKGNIRELRNTIERCVIIASDEKLNVRDLPLEIQMSQDDKINMLDLASVEKIHITKMLKYTGGNKTEAARLMKIGLTTLYRKMEEYGIH